MGSYVCPRCGGTVKWHGRSKRVTEATTREQHNATCPAPSRKDNQHGK